jgi:hypothetical protein
MKHFRLSALVTLLLGHAQTLAAFFQLAGPEPFTLAGSNPPAGTVAVHVAGEAASFNAITGEWNHPLTRPSGHHQLAVEFFGLNFQPLRLEFRDVVVETKTLSLGGTLAGNLRWTTNDGVIRITNSVRLAADAQLTIDPGVVVLLSAGTSLRATNAVIVINGTAEQPVHLLPDDGSTVWGELVAAGPAGALEMRHAQIAAGAVKIREEATGLLEDSYIHHYKSGGTPIAGCTRAKSVTIRRCHFNGYHETLWQFTPMLIEDSLFENADNPSSDALDFDGVPAGSVIRRCTFRNGPQSNTDAIDLGSETQGVVVEDCLMHDFPNDKGVSIGESSFGIVVRNCLVYRCDSGIAVKDNCTAEVYGCTFADNDFGFRNYNKANPDSSTGGGHITNSFNNLFWGNGTTVSLLNASTLVADHSDFGDTNWPGTGNFALNPRFVSEAERDYRLADDSPARGAGRDGATLGAQFPVGAPMAASHPAFTAVTAAPTGLRLEFWVDSTAGLTLRESAALVAGGWVSTTDFLPGPVPRKVSLTLPLTLAGHFYQLVSIPAP